MAQRKDPSDNTNGDSQQKKPRQRARRIKGTGSVYPRSDGRWGADFIVEATGKKKTLYGKTAKEAQAKLDKALAEQKQGILATGPQQKLADHLEWWLEKVHKHKLRPSSYIRYRRTLDKHLLPELGQIQLRKLTTRQIQEFLNKKLKDLSPSSVHQIHGVLHSALKSAVKYRYIPFNPADGIELPPDEAQREGQSLTLEQSKLLLKEVRGHWLETFVALALTTGMRHGEIRGLRWDKIDFEAGTISIHCTVALLGTKEYKYVEGAPKTKSGVRTVPLLPVMRDILESHRKEQEVAKLKAGDAWQENNLVCCTRNGGFLHPASLRLAFIRLLKKAGLPQIHIHDLRHTASTLWQSLGIDPTVRQKMLGHSSVDMTMTVYSHVLPSMQKDAIERINGLFEERS